MSVLICFILLHFIPTEYHPHEIQGIWLIEEQDSKVELTIQNGELFGHVVWLKEPHDENGDPVTDIYNTDKSMRQTPIMGLEVVNAQPCKATDGFCFKGKIYSPRRGKWYQAKYKLNHQNEMLIEVDAGWISIDKIWTRIE
jgi:hypothetical protein